MNYVATWLARMEQEGWGRGRGEVDSHLASGVMSRVGRQQPFPICQQDNCKRRLKVASTCHVLLPILPPPQFPHCPSVAKPCPFSQSPLDFCHFSTLSRRFSSPAPTAATTVYAFHRFCLHFASSFAFFFFAFFWQRKMLNTIFAVDLRFSTFFVYFGHHLLLLFRLFFLLQKGWLPSFNFTCHGCICSFFLCIAVQFNEQFFMSFQLGAPICLWFHLRNSQMRLQLPVECAEHSVGRVCCDTSVYLWDARELINAKSVNESNLIIVTNGLLTVFQRIQQVIEQNLIW